jgi:Tol biopolymer transport system component
VGGQGVSSILENPAWSPDDQQIAFDEEVCVSDAGCWNHLWVVNADGSGRRDVLDISYTPQYPSWSPDGEWIAFTGFCPPDGSIPFLAICKVRPDGSDVTQLYEGSDDSYAPDWSPDGTSVVFGNAGSIAKIGADGTGYEPIRAGGTGSYASGPVWSPDGSRIAFQRNQPVGGTSNVAVMNSDGTGEAVLTSGSDPSWQPIPQTYVRPKGATPMRVSLVEAYRQCTTPNSTHGAPLSFPSCNAAGGMGLVSPNVTNGTPEPNGAAANFTGVVRLAVVPGNPSTAADEADVQIKVATTDIRCAPGAPAAICGSTNVSATPDYVGELEGRIGLRLTDKDNTPNPGGPGPGTMSDTVFAFTIPCTQTSSGFTPDSTIGSSCSLQTTADALTPGMVKETRRTIWQLGQIQVYDGGPDGIVSTPGGNSLFAAQGLFVL